MSINIGDLVKIKTSTRELKNVLESPDPRAWEYSFSHDLRDKTGLVTSIARCTDDDTMWTPTILTILLETGESISINESKISEITCSEKPSSLSPGRRI